MPKTKYLLINPKSPEPGRIKEAVKVLKEGGIAAFPTETVFGLAALADNRKAVKRIYRLKKRRITKRLTIQVDSPKKILNIIPEIPDRAGILLKKFSPGPITLILKKKKGSVGIRIPNHKIGLAILKKVRAPLVVTSANLSGKKDFKTGKQVKKAFWGKIELIVDGKEKICGQPSTVVDLTKAKWRILRTGRISAKEIKKALC